MEKEHAPFTIYADLLQGSVVVRPSLPTASHSLSPREARDLAQQLNRAAAAAVDNKVIH